MHNTCKWFYIWLVHLQYKHILKKSTQSNQSWLVVWEIFVEPLKTPRKLDPSATNMRMYFWLHLVGSHSVARVVFLDPKKIEMNWTPKQAEWPRCEGRKQTTDFQYVWMSFTIIFRIYSWKHIPSQKWGGDLLRYCVVWDPELLMVSRCYYLRLGSSDSDEQPMKPLLSIFLGQSHLTSQTMKSLWRLWKPISSYFIQLLQLKNK